MDEENGLPMLPGLEKFQQLFDTEGGREWATEQTTRLNDFITRRELADANTRAGENFVENLKAFGDSLTRAVSRDPSFLPTAMEMARAHIEHTVASNPTHPEELKQSTYDELTGGLLNSLATSAVKTLGNVDDKAARALMDAEHVSSVLRPEDRDALSHYIDMQTLGRGVDAGGLRQMQAAQQAVHEVAGVLGHAQGLYNRITDDTQFPPGWAQNMLRDEGLSARARADLILLNARMQTQGDAKESDPFMIAQAVRGIVEGSPISPQEVLQNAGGRIRLPDALMLMGGALPLTTQHRGEWASLHSLIEEGQRRIAAPENGAAGARAFGRFVNWLMPQYRQSGAGSLNPSGENYMFATLPKDTTIFDRFRPGPQDFVTSPGVEKPARSLTEIFGGAK